MYFYSTPTLPNVKKFIAGETLLQLHSGALAVAGEVTPLEHKPGSNPVFKLDLLNPVTLDYLITVKVYIDGGCCPCLNLLSNDELQLGVKKVIQWPAVSNAFELSEDDEVLLSDGREALVSEVREQKYSPTTRHVFLSNGEYVTVDVKGIGVNGGISILAARICEKDSEDD